MSTENERRPAQAPHGLSRRQQLLACVVVLVFGVSALVLMLQTGKNGQTSSPELQETVHPVTPSTSSHSGEEKDPVDRLHQILKIREEAYSYRNAELLNAIYTTDCPCLSADTNAIRELLRRRHVWKGVDSSIRVRRVKKINKQIWSVLAIFKAESLRVETEDGTLVREEPQASELFQFTLVSSPSTRHLLLARVVQYKGG